MQNIYPGPESISDEKKMSLLTNKINTISIDLDQIVEESESIVNSIVSSVSTMATDLIDVSESIENSYSKNHLDNLCVSTKDMIDDIANKNVKIEDVYTISEMGNLYESRASFYEKTQMYTKDEMKSEFLNLDNSDLFYTKSYIDGSTLSLQEEIVGVESDLLPFGNSIQIGGQENEFQTAYISSKIFLSGEEVSLDSGENIHFSKMTIKDTGSNESCLLNTSSVITGTSIEEKNLLIDEELSIHEMYRTALEQSSTLAQIKTQLNLS